MKSITISFNSTGNYSISSKLINLIEIRYQTRVIPKKGELTLVGRDTASLVKAVLALQEGQFNITRLDIKEHTFKASCNSMIIASALLGVTQHNIRYAKYLLDSINYDMEV